MTPNSRAWSRALGYATSGAFVCLYACAASEETPPPVPQASPKPVFQHRVLARGAPFVDIASLAAAGDEPKLYVSDRGAPQQSGNQAIFVVELPGGEASTLVRGLPLSAPNEMLIGDGRGPWGRDLVIADHNSDETQPCCTGRVFAVDRRTGRMRVLAAANPAFPTDGDPSGLALPLEGGPFPYGLYVMDFAGAAPSPPVLYRITENGSAVTFVVNPEVWTTDRAPMQIAFGGDGGFAGYLYVTDPETRGGSRCIWRVSSSGEVQRFTDLASGALAFAPIASPFGSDLYVLAGQRVLTVNTAGQVSTFLVDLPLTGSGGLCFSPSGERLFVGAGDTLVEVAATLSSGS
jgi:hypothetical protein